MRNTHGLCFIRVRLLPAECQHRFIGGEEQRVATRARQKLYLRIRLPMICLEGERQLAALIEDLGLSFRVGLRHTDRRHSFRTLIDRQNRT